MKTAVITKTNFPESPNLICYFSASRPRAYMRRFTTTVSRFPEILQKRHATILQISEKGSGAKIIVIFVFQCQPICLHTTNGIIEENLSSSAPTHSITNQRSANKPGINLYETFSLVS